METLIIASCLERLYLFDTKDLEKYTKHVIELEKLTNLRCTPNLDTIATNNNSSVRFPLFRLGHEKIRDHLENKILPILQTKLQRQ